MMTANKAPSLLKKIMAAWSSKRNELRVRIMIFFLLHKNMDKTPLARSFSHSLQALVTPPHHYLKKKYDVEDSQVNRLMYYNKLDGSRIHSGSYATNIEQEEDPDLTRVLFEESEAAMEEEAGAAEDVIECRWGPEVVKEVMEVEEENVDEAAEMFIKRFKREIQLQKQQSLEY